MPHPIPPGPYCPPDDPGGYGGPVIIDSEGYSVRHEYLSGRDNSARIMMSKVCEEHGIPIGVLIPRLVWHLTNLAVCANLNPDEKLRCWELARLVLAEASERMRAKQEV